MTRAHSDQKTRDFATAIVQKHWTPLSEDPAKEMNVEDTLGVGPLQGFDIEDIDGPSATPAVVSRAGTEIRVVLNAAERARKATSPLRIVLCHSSPDKQAVRKLHQFRLATGVLNNDRRLPSRPTLG